MSEWITGARRPEDFEEVLVTASDENLVRSVRYAQYDECADDFLSDDGGSLKRDYTIVAWRKMPDPYDGKLIVTMKKVGNGTQRS